MVHFAYVPAGAIGYERLEVKMETGKKMDMEEFAQSIRESIEQQGRFDKVSLQKVLKNNGVMRCGLLLHSDGINLVPSIYLEPFYEMFRHGTCMEEIIQRILEIHRVRTMEMDDFSFFSKFSCVKERICMRLVNREANLKLLENIPYRVFLDMAVVYYVDYYNQKIGAGTIQVHDSHMEMWGITEEELWETASVNTPERKPGRIEKMEDILAEIFAEQGKSDNECLCSCMRKNPVPMLVITNKDRMYGAAVVLYSGMLKQAADKIDGDLFILPSSLHEVIAVPVSAERDAAELKKMVMEVNRAQLQPEEMLSDNVYIYRREQDRLEIA